MTYKSCFLFLFSSFVTLDFVFPKREVKLSGWKEKFSVSTKRKSWCVQVCWGESSLNDSLKQLFHQPIRESLFIYLFFLIVDDHVKKKPTVPVKVLVFTSWMEWLIDDSVSSWYGRMKCPEWKFYSESRPSLPLWSRDTRLDSTRELDWQGS